MFGRLKRIEAKLDQLLAQGVKEMATLTDLETLLTAIAPELKQLGTDVDAIIAKLNASGVTIPDADLASLQAISDGLKAASTKIEAVVPPAPPAP